MYANLGKNSKRGAITVYHILRGMYNSRFQVASKSKTKYL